MESFEKLRDIASQNRISFEDVCVYALAPDSDRRTTETVPDNRMSDATVPEKRPEPWAFWEPSEGEHGTTALARLASSSPAVFADSILLSSRWTRLSFYTAHRLMELHFVRDRGMRRAFVLHGPEHTEWLNGDSTPIHETNEVESLALTQSVVTDYLKFFLYFLRGDDGAFVPVESSDEVGSAGLAGGDRAEDGELLTLEDVRAKARPLLMMRKPDPTTGEWVFPATIAYSGDLFSALLDVAPSGDVTMRDDETICALGMVVIPQPPSLKLGREDLLSETSDLEAALGEFEAAIDLEPENADAHCNRAAALKTAGRQPESLEEYRTAVSLAPDNSAYLRGFILALIHSDQVDDAVALADTITDEAARAAYHDNLGNLLREFGRNENTVAQYQAAVELARNNSTYRRDLANALFDAGRVGEAIDLAETLTDNASRAACHANFGDRLRELDHKPEAVAQYKTALKLAPNNSYRRDLGKALFDLKRVGEAIALADTFTDKQSRAAYCDQLGDHLAALGHKDEALAQYRAAIKLAPNNSMYGRDLTNALFDVGQVREAIALADTFTDKADQSAYRDGLRDLLRARAAIDWV